MQPLPEVRGQILYPIAALDHIHKIHPDVKTLFSKRMNDVSFFLLADIDVTALDEHGIFKPTILVIVSKEPPKSCLESLQDICRPFEMTIRTLPEGPNERSAEPEKEQDIELDRGRKEHEDEEDGHHHAGGTNQGGPQGGHDAEDRQRRSGDHGAPFAKEDAVRKADERGACSRGGGNNTIVTSNGPRRTKYTSKIHIKVDQHQSQEIEMDQDVKIELTGDRMVSVGIKEFGVTASSGYYRLETIKFNFDPESEQTRHIHLRPSYTPGQLMSDTSERSNFRFRLENNNSVSWLYPILGSKASEAGLRMFAEDVDENTRLAPSLLYDYIGEMPLKSSVRTYCVWQLAISTFPKQPLPCYFRFVHLVDQDLPQPLAGDMTFRKTSQIILHHNPTSRTERTISDLEKGATPSLEEISKDEARHPVAQDRYGTRIDVPLSLSGDAAVVNKPGIMKKISSMFPGNKGH
ncbi:hypothetical protein Hypma_009004 [Hypsizygus marmoreus]|uniref:Uncharacterized protein n=1 Tax=Hypsizygus marmoreus TaxID=39966 RepID=A0A369JSJ1_HYPMA|nr:hypothetical protein Hypma_009004 [Hypsizygus marmoreus]